MTLNHCFQGHQELFQIIPGSTTASKAPIATEPLTALGCGVQNDLLDGIVSAEVTMHIKGVEELVFVLAGCVLPLVFDQSCGT